MMLSDLSVRRPVFAAVAAIILCVIGAAAFVALPVRELPNIDPPSVSVTTTYRGASAEVVEERITQVIERQVSGIQGIDRVGSSSRDGVSRINVAFTLDVDLNEAANDVRDAVSRVISRLPDEVDPPQIAKADADAQPIMILQMASPNMNRLQLTDYANRYLVERLSTVPGVAQVNVAGALNYSMRIWLNPEAMAARGVTVQDVQTALLNQNLELPAGSLEAKDKDFTVRVARAYSRPDQFALMPIALPARAVPVTSAAVGAASPGASAGALPAVQSSTNATDYIVRLGDIARVEEGADEPRRVFRVNGVDQVGLTIQRQSQANDLQIADDINKALEDIRPTLPKGMTIVVGVDNTEFTREALHEVWITMAISLGLVALVNFIFLGSWRAALIPTIVAPICILATFTVLAALGFSLNLLTLLALILAIGLVVDDAIVVVENIQRRIDEGEPPLLGAERGARQVFFAVVATTAVLMAVFAPLMFMPGYVGRLFVELAVAVAGAVFFSALMALSLSPMLASKLLRPASNSGWLARNVDHAVDSVRESYRRSLDGMLGRKSTTFITGGLVVVLMLAAGGLYMALPKELVPLEDRGRVDLSFQAPEGSGFDYTARAVTEVERRARVMYDKGEITRYFVTQPTFGQNQFNTGGGFMNLPKEGKVNSLQLAAQLNRNFSDITSARVIASVRPSIQRPGAPGGGAPGLDLIVMGNEYPQIEAQIKPLLRAAEGNPGMARARLAYEPTSPRILVAMDRDKAAALGVSANAVGTALQTLFGSAQVTTYIKNGQEYDVILQTERAERQSENDLKRVYVRATSGAAVPLSALVTTKVTGDTANRPRVDRMRSITLSVQLNPGYSVGEGVDFLKQEIAKQPTAVSYKWGGLARDFLEGSGSVGVAFGVALLLVFLVLAAQFESWIHPVVIMITVPVAALGGLFGLLIAGSTMNTYSQIGLIILVGIAAKNGILIVEFANQLRDEGRSITEAVIESATLRLRPIVMTSISAAAGAVPLILWGGAGGESRKTIGVTIFFGAIVATMVTLFVVPVFYNLLARFTKSPEATARKIEEYERDEENREGDLKGAAPAE